MKKPLTLDGVEFVPISPKLAVIRLVLVAILLGLPTLLLIFLAVFLTPWIWIPAGVFIVALTWAALLIPCQIRAKGYATAEGDLIIRSGFIFRKLISVPYGRIQYVDIHEGPFQRLVGLATVQLHTASVQTQAVVKGLTTSQATQLRDLLVANGISEMSGL